MTESKMPDRRGTLVRFDFPPGATSKEIAAAITALREKLLAAKAERERREAEEKTDGD